MNIFSCKYKLIFSLILFAPALVQAEDYLYIDCSDQAVDILMTGCSKLRISADLRQVKMVGNLEDGLDINKDNDMLAIESKLLPLSVPKKGYEQLDSWHRGDRKYVKIRKNWKVFPQNKSGDVIAVVSNANAMTPGDSANGPNDPYLIQNTKITFLYSQPEGVLAIGIIDRGDYGGIYWCASRRCLFGTEDNKSP